MVMASGKKIFNDNGPPEHKTLSHIIILIFAIITVELLQKGFFFFSQIITLQKPLQKAVYIARLWIWVTYIRYHYFLLYLYILKQTYHLELKKEICLS